MYVRDWMTADLVVATPQTSVLYARRLLARHDIRHLPVVDGSRLAGIVSDRDLRVGDRVLAAVLAPLQSDLVGGRDRPIEAIMSQPVHTVAPSETLAAAAKLMLGSGVSALPVIDEGRLVGILTTSDCLRAIRGCLRKSQDDSPAPTEPLPAQMPPGDNEPGRLAATAKPQALVVNPNTFDRAQIARRLESAGYKTLTCPGPNAGALCPAVIDPDGAACLRLPAELNLIVVDPDSASPDLLAAYLRWAPCAELHIQDR
jgi:acetoin utilization protein AcuB